jgi:hypothetical protein
VEGGKGIRVRNRLCKIGFAGTVLFIRQWPTLGLYPSRQWWGGGGRGRGEGVNVQTGTGGYQLGGGGGVDQR